MPDPGARYGAPLLRKEQLSQEQSLKRLLGLPGGGSGNPIVGAAKKRSAGRTGGGVPGLEDINALEGMLGSFGGVDPSDMSSLQAELRKAIAGQFDPQIANTKSDMSGAKKRAGAAKQDIGALYNDLVSYYQGQVAPTKERSAEAKKSAKDNASGLKQSITSDYADRIRDQVDEYKRLGIQAASGSATEAQEADRANQMAVAEQTRSAEEAALNQQAQGDLAYWTEGSGIAKGEGAEQQSVITQQLNQYLNDQSKQLSLLKGQKSSAYHEGLMNLQQQAAQAASQQQNQLWSRMMDLARLKLSTANSAASGTKDPGPGLTGALSFLQQQGDGNLGGTFQKYLAESQRWANTPSAKAMYGGSVDTPEEWAQVMRDNAANKGLGSGQQQSLWQAMLRYMGRK